MNNYLFPGRCLLLSACLCALHSTSLKAQQPKKSTDTAVLRGTDKNLGEVIVVGYGTQKKATLTGAVTQISGTEIRQSGSVNISNALAGRMPGVVASNRTGEPGNDGSAILIRGAGTTGNTAPLYVIDGVANRSGFERLNPNDIESISVLKDAAAAIYGAQAANGVILVTTKRGKSGKPSISYDGNFGLSQPTRIPKLVNAYQYALYRNEKDKRQNGASAPVTFSDEQIRKYKDGSDPLNYPSTDWTDAVIKPWTPQTQHSITISGGADRVKYYVSGAYTYQDAFYRKSATNYKQYNLRSNIDAQLTNNFKVGVDIAGRLENRQMPPTGAGSTPADGIFLNMMGTYPGLAPFYPNGLPQAGAEGPNTLQLAQGYNGYTKRANNSLQTTATFEWKLPAITPGLAISGFAAHDFSFYNEKTFTRPFDLYRYDSTNKVYNNVRNSLLAPTSLYESYGNSLSKTYHLKLSYEKRFNEHFISAFIAYEQSDYYNEGINASRGGLISTAVDQMFAAYTDAALVTNGGNADQNARRNYFGRLNYTYKDKYLAELVMRRDGSFNFAPGHQYGNFPGASIGWRISEEPFLKQAAPFINNLKVRAAYSELGNDRINQYQFLTRYRAAEDLEHYFLGSDDNPTPAPGLMTTVTPNPDVTWEVEKMKNFGLEASLWNGKLDLTVDYYTARRNKLLAKRNASVPATAGFTLPDENIGVVDRHGIEITAGTRGTIGEEIHYNVTANFTQTHSKIVFIDEPASVPDWQKRQGYQLGSNYNESLMYLTDGIFHTQKEIDDTKAKLPGSQPGDIRYIDYDGDGAITAKDRVRSYQNATPLIIYGVTMSADYKGIAIRLLWQGQSQAKQMIIPQANNAEFIPPIWIYENRWTPENPNATMPGAFDRSYSNNVRPSDFWLQDMSFLKLKSAEVSYTFAPAKLTAYGINNLRIYLSGFNLFSFDKVKNYDPETISYTGAYYPQTRIFNLGVNLNF
ncbi:TonB-dependent receptor [Chitinophaga sp.]|uniref:SusC/RagA family TonB-linked outer membrane protein n=1 Tax=Chitinophaga sp. TaxID=1869181 RepID=UPI002F942327